VLGGFIYGQSFRSLQVGKLAKKKQLGTIDILLYIIIPFSVFWILYRHGFLSVIDALAVGILAAAGILFSLRWLAKRKIISFG
jgi:hypothetical protein